MGTYLLIINVSTNFLFRLWDAKNNCEIKKVDLKFPANDIELSGDGRLLTVAYSDRVTFLDAET